MDQPRIRRTGSVFVVLTGKGEKPFLRYAVSPELGVMQILETYVPPELRGKGIAEKMMEEALKFAEQNKLKIEPICSYAFYYFVKFKNKRSMLVDWLKDKSDEELMRMFEYRRSLEQSKKNK